MFLPLSKCGACLLQAKLRQAALQLGFVQIVTISFAVSTCLISNGRQVLML
jgi:hypothetical protein